MRINADGEKEWEKTLGDRWTDKIESVVTTSDGGFIACGCFSGTIQLENEKLTGSNAGMIIKYNSEGKTEWAKKIDGSGGYSDLLTSVIETEKEFIACGYFSGTLDLGGIHIESNGNSDGIIIKFNKDGEIKDARNIGGNGYDYIEKIVKTKDEGYAVGLKFDSMIINIEEDKTLNNTDRTYSNIGIIKFDKNDKVKWTQSIGGDSYDYFEDIIESKNEELILAGSFQSKTINFGDYRLANSSQINGRDSMIVGFSKKGEISWISQIEGNLNDIAEALVQLEDESFLIGGSFNSEKMQIGDKELDNKGSNDGFIAKLTPIYGAQDQSELEVKNKRKEYKITTDVQEIDGKKGGSITGEDLLPYEVVKYGDNSTKEIKMTPDENYEIIGITVNGEDYPYDAEVDGTYIMPQFENVTEDKHIVVKYSYKDNKITINKVNKDTGEKLPNATFKLDQIDERALPEDAVGNLTDNSKEYDYANKENEVTGVLGTLTNNGDYYFVEQDGKYLPTNSKTWQTANVEGATAGVGNTTANSYMELDLTEKAGKYAVVVNAEVSSQSSYDYGYATITESESAPAYNISEGQFMQIAGTQAAKDYTTFLDGGKKYYLHLGYRKNASTDTNQDQVIINSINVYGATVEYYNFASNEGKYESTNQGKDSTISNSYIPINLDNREGKYNLTVNAEISSQSSDYGYATITETPERVANTVSTGRFINISGTKAAQDYTTVLEGGKIYYLHLGYYKNASTSTGDDKFTVNSVEVTLNDSELYHTEVTTNSEGQAITQIPFGKYMVTEISAPDGYIVNEAIPDIEFRADGVHEFTIEDEEKAKVTVHHYEAIENEDSTITYTENKLAEDELQEDKIGEDYTTSPNMNIRRFSLLKNTSGDYVIPDNANGTFTEDDQEVNYYYTKSSIPLIVHHYIEGTENPVPLKGGEEAEDTSDSGEEGEKYITTEISSEELASNYELIEVPENNEGTYEGDEVIVTYYYREIKRGLTLIKYDEDRETPLGGATFEITTTEIDIENGEEVERTISLGEYTTDEQGQINITTGVGEYIIKETHAPDGYKLDETDYSVIITRDTQEAKIEIPNEKKRGTVIVHYYLQEDDGTPTTTPIKLTDGNNAEDLVKIGIVGDTYVTKPHEDAAEYYELVSETPVYSSGEYIDGDIEVTYYYKEKKFEYTVEYYYDNVRDDSKTEEKEAKYGDEITTYTDKVIEGYKFEKKENLPLTISSNPEENVIKIYYVKRNDLQYIVNYLEKGTENVLHKTKTVENQKFQDVINSTDEVISIYGYDYDSADKEGITLQIDSSKNVINLYYTKKDTSLVVKYVDVNTNEEIAIADRSTGKVGDEYRTTNKIITGYVYLADRAPENANGTLKEEETTVTYYYVKNTKVIVKYIDKITGDELTREITIEGKQGDPYTTVQREFNNYELVEVTGAREGEMAADTIEVIYYYVHNSAGVEVNYLDANTNEPLAEQDILEGKEGDRYTTRPKAYVEGDEATARLKGYELVESRYPDNSEGEMTINKIVVNYYYAKKTNVIVKYKDINTGEDIITPITIPGHDGDDYETEEKDFDNYVLVERPTNKEGKMLEEPIEVIYYYAHISAGVIEKHFDEFTGELLDSKTYEGKEGDRYTTSSKTFNGYELDEEKLPSNATGTMTQDVIEVDYYYRYKTNVVARYIDKITEAPLTENVSKDGYEGEKYNTERKTFEGYELVEVPENADGNMTRDTIIVTYYYVNTSAGVKVNHYDIITGEKIVREETIKGKVGDDYTTSEKELENYDIVEERYPLNREGTMTREDIKVDYYYIHKAKVTTKYIDKVTGEELTTPITVPGHEGDPYKTEEKTFENYKLEEVPTNKEGTMTKEDIEVIYYYVRESAGVKVNHYDVVTGEKIIDEETISGYEGDIYETKEKSYEKDDEKTKEFKDYDLVEEKYPENATGTMTKEVAYVDYYYIKKSTVRVKYVDKATGEELTEDIIIEGHEGEEYETEEKQFEDYDIVEDEYPENTKGTIEKEEKQVIYYYKKKTKVKSEYIDKETNEKIETDEEIEGHEGDSYKTLEKKIEYYDLIEKPENSTGDMTKEEIKVKYYYKKKIFNLGIDKKVKATIRNGERREVNKDSAKQEIYSSQVSKTSIKAEYSIVVTNKGEIAGTAKIEENIPEGMKMLQEENKDWTIMGNTAILTTEEIQPGSSKEYVVTLTWDNNKSNYGVRENIVRIVEVTNKAKYSETDLTDNESKATFAITVPTGIKEYGKISGIVLIILITVAGEIVAIKKKNNQ